MVFHLLFEIQIQILENVLILNTEKYKYQLFDSTLSLYTKQYLLQ